MFPIINQTSNCTDCYRCLRSCSVKAISFKTGQAKIMPEKCVLCGRCVQECAQNTKTIYSQMSRVENLLADKSHKVALSLSPTFINFFNQWTPQEVFALCRAAGFALVEELATMGNYYQYCREILESDDHFYVSSNCPVIVNMIEKFYPNMLDHLLPVDSPAALHSMSLKKRYGADWKVVHVTSCLGELDDQQQSGQIDAMLTFAQLEEMLVNLDCSQLPEFIEEEPPYELVQEKLAFSGGLADWLVTENVLAEQEVQVLSGIKDCQETLRGLNKKLVKGLRFVELTSCRGGCVSGLNLERKGSILEKTLQIAQRQQEFAHFPRREDGDLPLQRRAFISRLYQPKPVATEDVKEVLATFRQYNKKKVLNCGACGYDTCYEKAVAVVRGEAEQEMCMTYMKAKAESTAHTIVRCSPNAIIVFDQDFIIQEANPTARQMFEAYGLQEGNAMFEYMDIRHFERVVETGIGLRDKVVHYPDLDLWTRQIVVRMYDSRYLYLAIITDITEQEKKKLEVEKMKVEMLDKANQVINNQMLVAQEIAGLLGETTAETKITLVKLIKQFEQEKELE